MTKSHRLTGPLHGYLAQPDAGARAGVLILPTIFGVNSFASGFADRLADAGLVAAV
jgi:dienelactone hydrolase